MSHERVKPASFYGSPGEAMDAPPEEFLYLACLHRGTGVDAPDFLAVVDAEDGRIAHETPMPNVGDELHHFGWNRCSSACHGPDRSHLIVPGFRSSRIHILNVADDPRRPRIERVIEPRELAEKTGYTRPHTVHCMPGDNIVVSMLGDADGGGACGFAVLDARTFEVKGRWENGGPKPSLNYDFWYQPRKNVLISSEFGEPNAYEPGFDIDDVGAGRYGQRLHFWDLAERRLERQAALINEKEEFSYRYSRLKSHSQYQLYDDPSRPGPPAQKWSGFQTALRFASGKKKPSYSAFKFPIVVKKRRRGVTVTDLTESNPTHVGLTYPPDLLQPLASPRSLVSHVSATAGACSLPWRSRATRSVCMAASSRSSSPPTGSASAPSSARRRSGRRSAKPFGLRPEERRYAGPSAQFLGARCAGPS